MAHSVTQYLDLPEGRIAYDVIGSGPLVIALPGMGDLRGEYRYLVPQLVEAGYRVVTADLRGHGESSVGWEDYSVAGSGKDALELIRHLGGEPAIVIGNSMAAGAAIWAAVEDPHLIRGIVLIGPAVHGDPDWKAKLLYRILFARPWGPTAWFGYYNSLFRTRRPNDLPEFASRIKQNLTEPGRMEALKNMMLASKAASEERLTKVSVPALILMGTLDQDFKDPNAEAKWVADKVKGSFQMIDGAGHYPQTEMPEITGPKIIAFLNAVVGEAPKQDEFGTSPSG